MVILVIFMSLSTERAALTVPLLPDDDDDDDEDCRHYCCIDRL